MKIIDGGVTAAKGFKAAGMHAGIKKGTKKDMAMIVSSAPCMAAGTFTTNLVKAAPVKWDQHVVYEHGEARAVVVNSGIANACTGAEGYGYCEETAKAAAEALGIDKDEVLVASTGVIGKQLPIDTIKKGVKDLSGLLLDTREAATLAAESIMTTDTVKKEVAVEVEIGGKTVTIGGVYAGNYQLVGNVRIDKSRVNIHNWEDVASDAAKAIAKKEGIKGDAKDALEDYMTEHLEWITSGSLSYNGKTYQIEDYYTDLPKDSSGKIDVSGGYLFELDAYYDEVSKFHTKKNQPIMFKNPEFANTNTELFTAAQNYVQAVEDSINSEDYYTTYNGEKKHYTDLVDLDSLVRYLMLNEFYWNTETMKKSTYMYKDLGGKLFIGPVWDMDWTSNSQISAGETSNYRAWMVVTRSAEAQANSWYKTLIGDPYFVTKLYECYKENRQNFEDIVKTGGILDQQKEYLLESGNANYQAGYLMHRSTFESEVERLRTFLKNRLDWMDQQFTSVDTLLASLGKYRASSAISVTETTSAAGKVLLTAEVKNNNSIKKVGFYVNGVLGATVTVENGKAVFEVSDDLLTRTEGGLNTVQSGLLKFLPHPLPPGHAAMHGLLRVLRFSWSEDYSYLPELQYTFLSDDNSLLLPLLFPSCGLAQEKCSAMLP